MGYDLTDAKDGSIVKLPCDHGSLKLLRFNEPHPTKRPTGEIIAVGLNDGKRYVVAPPTIGLSLRAR